MDNNSFWKVRSEEIYYGQFEIESIIAESEENIDGTREIVEVA